MGGGEGGEERGANHLMLVCRLVSSSRSTFTLLPRAFCLGTVHGLRTCVGSLVLAVGPRASVEDPATFH